MKVIIEIECEDKEELLMHLDVISSGIEIMDVESITEKGIFISDANCYGRHEVTIKP